MEIKQNQAISQESYQQSMHVKLVINNINS